MFKLQASRPGVRQIARVPLSHIEPNPSQPRRVLSEDSIAQLAESIRRHGQLSPLVVRSLGEGGYELIAGQRRLLALKHLGRKHADALVIDAGDCESALIALVENLQREDLHFFDLAEALRHVLERYPITQERLAATLSMSASALANRLRLLKLSPEVREIIRATGLSERHARALLSLESEDDRLELASQAASQRLSVKQLEVLIRQQNDKTPPAIGSQPANGCRPKRQNRSLHVRDGRIVVNAFLDTARELKRIGVRLESRVERHEDALEIVIRVPLPGANSESTANCP